MGPLRNFAVLHFVQYDDAVPNRNDESTSRVKLFEERSGQLVGSGGDENFIKGLGWDAKLSTRLLHGSVVEIVACQIIPGKGDELGNAFDTRDVFSAAC